MTEAQKFQLDANELMRYDAMMAAKDKRIKTLEKSLDDLDRLLTECQTELAYKDGQLSALLWVNSPNQSSMQLELPLEAH